MKVLKSAYQSTKPRGKVQCVMRLKAKVIIEAHTISKILIKTILLPKNRDFSFRPKYKTGLLAFQYDKSFYSYLVDSNMSFV